MYSGSSAIGEKPVSIELALKVKRSAPRLDGPFEAALRHRHVVQGDYLAYSDLTEATLILVGRRFSVEVLGRLVVDAWRVRDDIQ
jgi:hypothetical protein